MKPNRFRTGQRVFMEDYTHTETTVMYMDHEFVYITGYPGKARPAALIPANSARGKKIARLKKIKNTLESRLQKVNQTLCEA